MRKSLVLLPLALMAGSVWIGRRVSSDRDRSGRERIDAIVARLAGQDRRRQERHSPNGRRACRMAAWWPFAITDTGWRRSVKTRAAGTRSSSCSSNRSTRRGSWARLDKAVPRGQTPIAYSLQQAAQDFGAPSDEERAMILVSDGIETCGGDPLATVRDLTAKGFKVKVHTIGFDVDAAARAQLEAISERHRRRVLRRAQCLGVGRHPGKTHPARAAHQA